MTQLVFTLFLLAPAIGVPVMIAYYLPKRWRLPAMAFWVLLPLFVGLVLAGVEKASASASHADFDKLLFGLLLIGSVLAVPWLAACGIGYAIGAARRRRLDGAAAEPAAETLRDLATRDSPLPLTSPADPAPACDDLANAYAKRQVSPDGSLLVELEAVEWSNTHWVHSPRVTEIATGRVVLDLWGTDWDAAVSFPRAQAVRLSFRRYHFGGRVEAEIDLAGDRYTVFGDAGEVSGPIAQLPEALEQAARNDKPPPAPVAKTRSRTPNWGTSLLILMVTLVLIAAATVITLHFQDKPPPQRLDAIPRMPGG